MRGGRLRAVLSRAREIGDVVVVVVVVAVESGRKGDILPSFAIPLLPVPTLSSKSRGKEKKSSRLWHVIFRKLNFSRRLECEKSISVTSVENERM